MSRKGQFLFGLDLLNAVLLASLVLTGILIKWGLPPGAGRHGQGGGTFLALSRHDWGELHFWIAIAFVAAVVVHLAMHAGFIRSAMSPKVPPKLPALP